MSSPLRTCFVKFSAAKAASSLLQLPREGTRGVLLEGFSLERIVEVGYEKRNIN